MSSVIAPGDIAGLVLLAAAMIMPAVRAATSRLPASWLPEPPRTNPVAARPSAPPQAAGWIGPPQPAWQSMTVPRQSAWQSSIIPPQQAWQSSIIPAQPTLQPTIGPPGQPLSGRQPVQSPSGQLPHLVEDRVPGPAALQLEEAIGACDQ